MQSRDQRGTWTGGFLPLSLAALVAFSAACSGDDNSGNPVQPPADTPPTIVITAPAGGMAYQPGADITIQWTANDDNGVTGVDLSYTADGGKSGTITTGAAGSSFAWTTPMEDLFGVKIKAVASDASNQTAEDETSDIFAVVAHSDRGYVTSSVCGNCHESKVDDVFKSGHPYKLSKVVDGTPPTYPSTTIPRPPQGFAWDDISYVIGGYNYKARFMDSEGFILLTGIEGVDTQYNIAHADIGLAETWSAYEGSRTSPKPYTCGGCHTTGWQTTADNGGVNQDGLPGIAGTWEEPGITCEACHGAGVDHVATKDASNISIDREKELCGSCHFRDTNHGILASGGFIQHHEQYDEMISAGHVALSCTDCHNPHIGTKWGNAEAGGITVTCESCHADKTSNKHLVDVECTTCHMPRATKSAQARHTFQGDVQTHIFKINAGTETKDAMFYTEGGSTFTNPFVTLDFVCYQCHTDPLTGAGGGKSSRSMDVLSFKATGIHN